MWDFLSKNCGIFSIEGGTKLWDFQHRGGDFRPLTSGHTDSLLFWLWPGADVFESSEKRCFKSQIAKNLCHLPRIQGNFSTIIFVFTHLKHAIFLLLIALHETFF